MGIINISHKINEINSLLNIKHLNIKNSFSGNISNEIIQNLEMIKNYIKNQILIMNNNTINDKEKVKELENKLKKEEKFEYKNIINLIYFAEKEGDEKIFGYEFIKNNRDNIDLIINGNKTNLIDIYNLKKGENIVTLIIKNKLTDLSYMFCNCFSLKNMEELRYLDTENVTNFSFIFAKEYKTNFSYIFPKDYEQEKLFNVDRFHSFSDINCLSTWNVTNGIDFTSIFRVKN